MKISCKVQVEVISTSSTLTKSAKLLKSVVIVGRSVSRTPFNKSKMLSFMLCTANNNGTTYLLENNVDRVYCAFVATGKMTFTLKKPSYRFVFNQADPEDLSMLASILKRANTDVSTIEPRELSELTYTHITDTAMVTRLTVTEGKEIPTPLPNRLQMLTIDSYFNLTKIGSDILAVQSLVSLDLSGHKISAIPNELSSALPRLATLNLANNMIRRIPVTLYTLPLRVLNLEGNPISSLGEEFCRLTCLRMCNVSNCTLTRFPDSIGKMQALRVLNVSDNKLQCLPYSFKKLKLENLAMHGNPFNINAKANVIAYKTPFMFPSLLELSARCAVPHSLPKGNLTEYIPMDLLNRLRGCKKCSNCNCRIFNNEMYKQFITLFDCTAIATTVTLHSSTISQVPLLSFACAKNCMLAMFPRKKRNRTPDGDTAEPAAQRART
eukprot:CFRG2120T1